MKLALSALLLSTALVAAPLAQAAPLDGPQTPPTPGSFGPGGPHGHEPMMFGPRAAHRVETITNSPITAQFTETANFTTRDGKQEQRTSTSTVYRDSQGRVREEMTLPPPPPPPADAAANANAPAPPSGPHTIITILDPVAHTITHLEERRKVAIVQTVPADFFTRADKRDQKAAAGDVPRHDNNATVTSLGSKVIAGVSATGESITRTMPARDGGAVHTMTHETWFSPDLKFEVSSSETSDRGTHTDTLTSLSKAEPAVSLFQVPAGYTTQTAPEHHFGGRHGGPGGPGGQSGDDAPPPPPSM